MPPKRQQETKARKTRARKTAAQKTAPLKMAALKKVSRDSAARDNAGDGIDIGMLGGWVGFHLRMAQIASFQSFARHAKGIDLSPGRFAALVLIDRNPGISQTALSRAIGSDKSTLTPMLDKLVKTGLVSRERTHADRRLYQLKLTAAGKTTMRKMQDHAQQHEKNLDALVGARDRALFVKILSRIAATRE